MISKARQLAIELLTGIMNGEMSLNAVADRIDKFLSEFVTAAIEHQIEVMAEGEDTPAATPRAQSVSVDDDEETKPHVDFETGKLTRKKRKKRGYVWIMAIKNADGTIKRKGYYVSKRKLGRGAHKRVGIKRPDVAERNKARTDHVQSRMSKRDHDMFVYFKKKFVAKGWTFTGSSLKEARIFNETMTNRTKQKASPDLKAKRERSRMAFYVARAKKKGWPIPTTLDEGVAQNYKASAFGPGQTTPAPANETTPPNEDKKTTTEATAPLKTAAVRVYQPHVRKASKTYRKMRKKAAKMRTV